MTNDYTGPGARPSLRQTPLLELVSNETLRLIDRTAKRHSYVRGQEIVAPSDDMNDVFILLSGLARVTVFSVSGKAVNFRRIDPGDLFGEFSAIDGQKRSASVEAVEPSTALFHELGVFSRAHGERPRFYECSAQSSCVAFKVDDGANCRIQHAGRHKPHSRRASPYGAHVIRSRQSV